MADASEQPPQKLLGFWPCLALVVGTLIGSGIYGLPSQLAPFGWNALFGWLVTIAGALCLAHVFARLSHALPSAAGPYAFAETAFGRPAAFAVAWSYWISIWVGNAAIAITGIAYLSPAFPALADPAIGAPAAIVLVWLLTALNCFSLRAAGGFQVVTVALKLIPLLLIIGIAAVVLASGAPAPAGPGFDSAEISLDAINGAAAVTLWALLGFEAAAWASRNVRDPARNVPRATVGGTLVVAILYLLVSTAIAVNLPAAEVAGSEAPVALFIERFWGSGIGLVIALFGAVSVIGALNGLVLLQGELPLAMARDGAFPAWFARVSRNGRPVRAQIVSSLLTTLLILMSISGERLGSLFATFALQSTAAILVLYLIVALATLELQRRKVMAMRAGLAITAIVGAVYALWAFYGAGRIALVTVALMIVAGVPFYLISRGSSRPAADAPAALPE